MTDLLTVAACLFVGACGLALAAACLRALEKRRRLTRIAAAFTAQNVYGGGSVRQAPLDPLWESCRRRAAIMPFDGAWDSDAAALLIAATCGGRVCVIPHPDHAEENVA